MLDLDYHEVRTPQELYERVKSDWKVRYEGSLNFGPDDPVAEGQRAALRLRAENADKNLPPVPSSGGGVDLLNWCIEAQKCFAQDGAAASGKNAAGGKAETPTGNGDADRFTISTKEAIQRWNVSRATLKRYREEGTLTGHRPPDAPKNATYFYNTADLDKHFPQRKKPLGAPRA